MTYEALTKAGVPLFAYGNFITVVINFIILAFIIFLMVKQINRLKREEPAAATPAPPEEVLLLRRDSRFAEALIVHARRGKPARRPFFLRSFP